MVQFDSLDIIPGLEEAFFDIVQWADQALGVKLNSKRTKVARANRAMYRNRSYFLRFQYIYNHYPQVIKDAWTAYWLTLPYGDHHGGNGWPGSGFSAFIAANHVSIRDFNTWHNVPPMEIELLTNGDFVGSAAGWTLNPSVAYASDSLFYTIPPPFFVGGSAQQPFSGVLANAYGKVRCEFEVIGNGRIGVAFSSFDTFTSFTASGSHHFSFEETNPVRLAGSLFNIAGIGIPASGRFVGELRNVSLKTVVTW